MTPDELRKILKEELDPIKVTLGEHSKILGEHSDKIDSLTGEVSSHSDKLDALAGELSEVHILADATLDIVKARYEKNKQEIDEIKDHLKLPKEPYFGEAA